MNQVNLVGRVGEDVKVTTFENGKLGNFSLATNENYTDKTGKKIEVVEWHKIQLNDKLVESYAKHINKGDLIRITGKIKSRTVEKDGKTFFNVDIVAMEIEFLAKKSENTEV